MRYYLTCLFLLFNTLAWAMPEKAIINKGLDTYKLRTHNPYINHNHVVVIDFSRGSYEERFFIIDIKQKKIIHRFKTSHAKKTGTIYPRRFSNVVGSRLSSLGVYRVGAQYTGKYGRSLRLHGLSKTNSNAYKRAIVIHPADYVKHGGRSWGCPAISYEDMPIVLKYLKPGTLLIITR